MWTEIAAGGGFLGLVGIILRFHNGRINSKMPRQECETKESVMCNKVDEVKNLLITMDEKREAAKDEWHEAQRITGERLSRIEGALNNR